MATHRDMTAQQKQAAEMLVTIKGLQRAGQTKAQSPSEKPQTPRDAYEAISATYCAERRPAPMHLILDLYWRDRESELARRVSAVEYEHTTPNE